MLAVKDKLARGDIATMVAVNHNAASLVEHLGRLGFDVAFIDCEKGSAGPERIEEMCRGARAAGIAAVVRPWTGDAGMVSRLLDIGADGIMQAGIDDAATAQALVDAVRYARFRDHADKLVIGMIESPRAIANLPSLLAVDGIDVWFVGPNDLAHRMGHPGEGHRPEVRQAVTHAVRQIAAAGKVAGTLATGDLSELRAAGARFLMTRANELLAQGAGDFQQRLARAAPPATSERVR